MKENTKTEFKELDRIKGCLPSSVPKEIVAFANTEGGDLYIGIRDDGTVVGVENTDDVMTRISNVAHDSILPNILPFIQIQPIEIEGKQVVKTSISVGTERPYYLAKEGLTPKGVYVRVGTACIPLNENGIREMIMETSGKSYEECRSMNQELTFNSMNGEMRSHNLEFGKVQMKTLKMIGPDDLYTNLGLLLSDQCPYTIKVAVFQDDGTIFRDRTESSGSLLKQLDEIYKFIDIHNQTKATFSGLYRTDVRDYPEDALREALLNAIVHRDYILSGSTIVNIYNDHIEFISLGGLARGLSLDTVLMGVSQTRNPNLAAIFYRLGMIESFGTGIRKIINLYKGFDRQPVFKNVEGAFIVKLFNRNELYDKKEAIGSFEKRIEDVEASILEKANSQGQITRNEIEEFFGFGTTKAYRLLKSLCDKGLLIQRKNGNLTAYYPIDKDKIQKN